MWIIAFKFVRASKVVHKILGLGTAKNNATQNEVFDKQESTKAWYELPEPKAAEKEGKLKKAEKEAARISQEREKAQKVESKDVVSSKFSVPPPSLGHVTTPGYIQVIGSSTSQRGRGSGGRGQSRGGRGGASASGGVRSKSSVINIKFKGPSDDTEVKSAPVCLFI